MTNEARIAAVTEAFASFTTAERVDFFIAVYKEPTFPQAVRAAAGEAVTQLNRLQFERRVQQLSTK